MTSAHDGLAGRLLMPGDPLYEQARTGRIFNARRPDRFPAAVLLAESDADVIEGVRLAAERAWTVSVRSGGHSWAAWSLRDDALLIDLGGLRDLAYDPATGVVSVRPAVKGGQELAPYLAERGRAFPGGHCPSVGLGGFLLPILFGALMDLTGVRSSAFMLLYGVVWVSLIWMYFTEVRSRPVLGAQAA